LPANAPAELRAGLYVWDDNHGVSHQSASHPLDAGQWHDLSFEIPSLHNVCLSEAGVVLKTLGEPWTGSVLLDHLDWDGTPCYSCDFAMERKEQGAISQWTHLRGHWRLQDGAYHGSGWAISESYSGDIDWRDTQLTVHLTPLVGDYHNINVRVQGALRSYALGLAPEGKLTLYKNSHGYRPVASVDFDWQHHHTYSLSLSAQGNRLQAQANGKALMDWVDEDAPYLHGQIGLSNFAGCHTRYEEMSVG
jgi:hypothetical protein